MKVIVDDLTNAIMRELSNYTVEAGERVVDSVDKTTKSLLRDLRRTSPSLTGDYRKGWTSGLVSSKKGRYVKAVFNKTDYQLTHLLEKGHNKTGGGRVAAIPHIAPAEEKAARQLKEMIEETLFK